MRILRCLHVQWDSLRGELVGLALQTGGPNGYARNLTWVTDGGTMNSAGMSIQG